MQNFLTKALQTHDIPCCMVDAITVGAAAWLMVAWARRYVPNVRYIEMKKCVAS